MALASLLASNAVAGPDGLLPAGMLNAAVAARRSRSVLPYVLENFSETGKMEFQ